MKIKTFNQFNINESSIEGKILSLLNSNIESNFNLALELDKSSNNGSLTKRLGLYYDDLSNLIGLSPYEIFNLTSFNLTRNTIANSINSKRIEKHTLVFPYMPKLSSIVLFYSKKLVIRKVDFRYLTTRMSNIDISIPTFEEFIGKINTSTLDIDNCKNLKPINFNHINVTQSLSINDCNLISVKTLPKNLSSLTITNNPISKLDSKYTKKLSSLDIRDTKITYVDLSKSIYYHSVSVPYGCNLDLNMDVVNHFKQQRDIKMYKGDKSYNYFTGERDESGDDIDYMSFF